MNRGTLPLLLLTIVLLIAPSAFAQSVIHGKPQSHAYTDLIAESEKYFSDKIETDKIVGLSAAIIMDGKVVWKRGFGFADRLSKTPMTENTMVNIGSVTKTFYGT